MPMMDKPTSSADWKIRLEDMESLGVDFRRKPLHRGSRGKNVATLQARLNERINAQLVVDGVFGRKTQSALKEFQANFPIRKDGVCGPVTWRYLWTV